MYIKIGGSLCILLVAAAVGFFKAEQLGIRVKRLMELKRMMILLQGELRFHRATLSEAFAGAAERLEEPFRSMLEKLSQQMELQNSPDFSILWQNMVKELFQMGGFLPEDEGLFQSLHNGLGYLDLTMQTETLHHAVLQTEEAIETAKKQQEIKGKLYRTIGVTAGAFIVLLVI